MLTLCIHKAFFFFFFLALVSPLFGVPLVDLLGSLPPEDPSALARRLSLSSVSLCTPFRFFTSDFSLSMKTSPLEPSPRFLFSLPVVRSLFSAYSQEFVVPHYRAVSGDFFFYMIFPRHCSFEPHLPEPCCPSLTPFQSFVTPRPSDTDSSSALPVVNARAV